MSPMGHTQAQPNPLPKPDNEWSRRLHRKEVVEAGLKEKALDHQRAAMALAVSGRAWHGPRSH